MKTMKHIKSLQERKEDQFERKVFTVESAKITKVDYHHAATFSKNQMLLGRKQVITIRLPSTYSNQCCPAWP